jgi:hypothetical protein
MKFGFKKLNPQQLPIKTYLKLGKYKLGYYIDLNEPRWKHSTRKWLSDNITMHTFKVERMSDGSMLHHNQVEVYNGYTECELICIYKHGYYDVEGVSGILRKGNTYASFKDQKITPHPIDHIKIRTKQDSFVAACNDLKK